MEYQICPNCNKKLDGLMKTKFIIEQSTTDFINKFSSSPSEAYCSGCSGPLIDKCKAELSVLVKESIRVIPIITVNSPLDWEYKILGMVTAQSVTGTGLLSEFTSTWSDSMGGQSGSFQNKLSDGEILCRNQLRYKAAMVGFNAVIAADVDYAEVGGGKGMLMVCMAGAAIKLRNAKEVLTIDFDGFFQLQQSAKDFNNLKDNIVPSMI